MRIRLQAFAAASWCRSSNVNHSPISRPDSSTTRAVINLVIEAIGTGRSAFLPNNRSSLPATAAAAFTDARLGPLPATAGLLNTQRSEEHTSELQSRPHLVCRLLL